MLLCNILGNSGRLWIHYCGRSSINGLNQINKFSKSCCVTQRRKLLCTKTMSSKTSHNIKRFYSDGMDGSSSSHRVVLSHLTDDKKHIAPNFFKLPATFFNLNFIIQRKLDRDFSIEEFFEGATQAVCIVSAALAREDYDSLKGLVAESTIDKLKNRISSLSQAEKELICVERTDVLLQNPYEINVFTQGDDGNTRTFVEIEMIFQTLRGRAELDTGSEGKSLIEFVRDPDSEHRLVVCNYTFIKDYTDGNDGPWLITKINHFSPLHR